MAYYNGYNKGSKGKSNSKNSIPSKNTATNKKNDLHLVPKSASTVGNIAQRSYTEGFKEAEIYYKNVLKSHGIK